MRPRMFYVIWDMGRATQIVHGHQNAIKAGISRRPFKHFHEAKRFAYEWNRKASRERPFLFLGHDPEDIALCEHPTDTQEGQLSFAF